MTKAEEVLGAMATMATGKSKLCWSMHTPCWRHVTNICGRELDHPQPHVAFGHDGRYIVAWTDDEA